MEAHYQYFIERVFGATTLKTEKMNSNPLFDFSVNKENKVQVDMLLTFDTIADLEKTSAMGFKEGMTTDFNQLDELLLTLKK